MCYDPRTGQNLTRCKMKLYKVNVPIIIGVPEDHEGLNDVFGMMEHVAGTVEGAMLNVVPLAQVDLQEVSAIELIDGDVYPQDPEVK